MCILLGECNCKSEHKLSHTCHITLNAFCFVRMLSIEKQAEPEMNKKCVNGGHKTATQLNGQHFNGVVLKNGTLAK